jgi:hypothetical protein
MHRGPPKNSSSTNSFRSVILKHRVLLFAKKIEETEFQKLFDKCWRGGGDEKGQRDAFIRYFLHAAFSTCSCARNMKRVHVVFNMRVQVEFSGQKTHKFVDGSRVFHGRPGMLA